MFETKPMTIKEAEAKRFYLQAKRDNLRRRAVEAQNDKDFEAYISATISAQEQLEEAGLEFAVLQYQANTTSYQN